MKLLSTAPLLPPLVQIDEEVVPYRTAASHDYFVVVQTDNTIHVISSSSGLALLKKPYSYPDELYAGGSVVIDGDNLILAHVDSAKLIVFNIPTETVLSTASCPDGQGIYSLMVLKRNEGECFLAACHNDGSICVWDMRLGLHLRTLKPHADLVSECAVYGSLITTAAEGMLAVSNWRTGEQIWQEALGEPQDYIPGRGNGNDIFAINAWEGKIIASTGDGRLWVFDLETGVQLTVWQASDGITQQLLLHGEFLIQVSWGMMSIWCSKTYKLLNKIQLFDRVVEKFELLNNVIVCCGRDAAHDEDACGLDPGLKGWRFVGGSIDNSCFETIGGEPASLYTEKEREAVFKIGSPVRIATGLEALGGNRIAVCVLRGLVWSVEIWQV